MKDYALTMTISVVPIEQIKEQRQLHVVNVQEAYYVIDVTKY